MSTCDKHESELAYLRQLKMNNGTTIQRYTERIQVRQQVIERKDHLLATIIKQSDNLLKMIEDNQHFIVGSTSIESTVREIRESALRAVEVGITMRDVVRER